jgi:hypothetical protein
MPQKVDQFKRSVKYNLKKKKKKKSKQISLLVNSWVVKGASQKFWNELERIFLDLFFSLKKSIKQNRNS